MSGIVYSPRSTGHAFTLIEIMIVIGIMGIIMTMSVPIVYKVFHRAPMAQVLRDVEEVCSNARARAILNGQEVDVVFHPQERHFEVSGGGASTSGGAPVGGAAPSSPASGLSGQIPEGIMIEMLDVNLTEYKDAELVRVRFYPNGTCDELTLIVRSDQGEWKKITTEITTGLVSIGEVR